MKVAIVHELLTTRGGAERVARIFADMFPEAPVYTLLYDQAKLGEWFPAERVRTPSYPLLHSLLPPPYKYNHHLYLNQFARAVESWDFREFDLVLSSSSAFAHGIITNGAPKHICYVHSPARYLWDRTHDVMNRASTGLLGPLKRWHLGRTFHRLREWDCEVAPRPDKYIAASSEVQRRIELYWREESEVIHPPIDDFWFEQSDRTEPPPAREHPDYFLIVSTLTPYKRIDLAVEACNQLGVHLNIVGEGPDRKRLESMAGPTIEFWGYREGDELKDLYRDAKATIIPGTEDFGLVPVESMACGTPVIAHRSGGVLESITEGETGVFFDEQTTESLQCKLEMFQSDSFTNTICTEHAEQFSRLAFETSIQKCIA